MIGVDILSWGSDGNSSDYYSTIYHYLWGGNIGHAALKLTLPCDPQHDALIKKYCCDGDESLIPHYQIKRKMGDREITYWVVYFSWWPNELGEEYDDRLSGALSLNVEYAENWKPYFPETIEQSSGYLRYKFGIVYDLIFGAPKQIPKPITEIIHPQQDQSYPCPATQELRAKETLFIKQEQEISKAMDAIEQLEMHMNYHFARIGRQLEFCFDAPAKKALAQKLEKKCQKIMIEIDSISAKIDPLLLAHKQLKMELKDLRRYYCDRIASVGCEPESTHLAFGEELSSEQMLKEMHSICKKPYDFDKIFYNCSTVVRKVIEAGLSSTHQGRSGQPHLFDTPIKISRFGRELQTELIKARMSKLALNGTAASSDIPQQQYKDHISYLAPSTTSTSTPLYEKQISGPSGEPSPMQPTLRKRL